MRLAAQAAIASFAVVLAHGAAAAVAVDFINASKPTRCAEEDNVYVKLVGPGIASFRVRAQHPPYIASVRKDSTAPDFSYCDMSQDPSFSFAPRKVVLYEDAQIRLVGHSFATFWRPDVVDFHVGDKTESGLHLVQLVKLGKSEVEMLVVYPADGYWRAKPLPPRSLPDTAYGSSFLFGPIEESTRPFVAIRSITFEPATMTFRLTFRNEARGTLRVASATRRRLDLDLRIDPPVPAGRPFAALRSMFVTLSQADVAIASRAGGKPASILEFRRMTAPAARFGRVAPSQHNLSAPDHVFDAFATAPSR